MEPHLPCPPVYMYLSDEVFGDVTGINTTAADLVAAPTVLMEVQEPKRSTVESGKVVEG